MPFGLSSAGPASMPATRGSRGRNFSGLTRPEVSTCGLRSNFGKQRTFDNSYTHPLRKETALKRMLLNIALAAVAASVWPLVTPAQIGSEKSIVRHLRDGEEFEIGLDALLKHGEALFSAAWTVQEKAVGNH